MQHLEKLIGDNKLLYAWFSAMYTRVDILLVSEITGHNLKEIADRIKFEVEKVEAIANRFDEHSEISRINNSAYLKPCLVTDEMYKIIDECLLYTSKTLGFFDITVNSLNKFTGGTSNIVLDNSTQSIRFLHADVKLDLSGYIKGYVLGTIRNILFEENILNALINMGNSSILAVGNHPHGKGWKVGIPDAESVNEFILFNQCLTTSGNKEQTKWPIQKPQTGETIVDQSTLSVITYDPALGEVLSKALFIATSEEKEMILKNFDEKIKWIV